MSHQCLVVSNEEHCLTPLVPMFTDGEVAELTWENGQLAIHELGGNIHAASSTKPTWCRSTTRTADTLESIVHQATCHKLNQISTAIHQHGVQNKLHEKVGSVVASTAGNGKWDQDNNSRLPDQFPACNLSNKRTRSDIAAAADEYWDERTACASANADQGRHNDTTFVTGASFDSVYGGSETTQEEELETKSQPGRGHSRRKGRASATHNQSERRRRDRINQKMKALQKLVPNARKTDKASMLEEVIEHLKQLQAQVQMMSAGSIPVMMPLGMQQHLLLAQMGMGMVDMSSSINALFMQQHHTTHLLHPSLATKVEGEEGPGLPPAFPVPPLTYQPNLDPGNCSSALLPDPYSTFLAQSINMDLYNKMAVMYRQGNK
ncbi:hypothetical protein Dimus_023992 [Dionaea muscipula]